MLRRVRAAASGIRAILYWGGEIERRHAASHRPGIPGVLRADRRRRAARLRRAARGGADRRGQVEDGDLCRCNAVRVAQRETWAYDGVRSGPPLYDILLHRPDYPDEIHYITPDIMPKVAGRWWAAIRSGCYGSGDGRGPRLESAVYDDASRSILLTFTDLDLPLYLPGNVTKAFGVRDDGSTVTITGVTLVAADQLRVKLASAAVGLDDLARRGACGGAQPRAQGQQPVADARRDVRARARPAALSRAPFTPRRRGPSIIVAVVSHIGARPEGQAPQPEGVSVVAGGIALVIIIVLLVLLVMGIRIVRPTHRGLVERLGKYNRYCRARLPRHHPRASSACSRSTSARCWSRPSRRRSSPTTTSTPGSTPRSTSRSRPTRRTSRPRSTTSPTTRTRSSTWPAPRCATSSAR